MESVVKSNRKLRKLIEPFYWWTLAFGIDAVKFVRAFRGLPSVIKEYYIIKKSNDIKNKYKIRFAVPVLDEKLTESGTASGHYFHQDLLVARKIFQRQPIKHVDIGSRVDGFVAHVATFREIEVFDIRTPPMPVSNMIFKQCDFMDAGIALNDYCDSISCLHALEHFGLGRYGDSIDINGHLRGFNNLDGILQSGGILYLSIPIGSPQRIEFNGHRVFAINTILEMAKAHFELIEFSYVDDKGDLHENVTLNSQSINNCDCYFGCGIFEFRKI
ncbi:MAG: hypothetical protein DRR16_05645 [Candidatus Parabeggiatoa sp. nov. 3]|nr:MAG: hypothetical protein DRR00_13640 [Gammaproteobacteria bacterium]RKZ65804.1 MAG: hypothetical protein DRQ99_11605 [Gammaproteobacteria bacterium]RKZ88155.1 MAG: hypothetical protein DRR16_05645 [Gammaproteobacteria bacterium]